MAAARMRTSADFGGRSADEGIGTVVLRWRFSSAVKERQSFGEEGEICHAEEVDGIVAC